MKLIDVGDADTINLAQLIFSAKIDFVTVYTPGKVDLPPLEGTRKWAIKDNYRKLSVHDASPRDVAVLREHLDDPRIAALEVAVDMKPKPGIPDDLRMQIIDALMVHMIAKGLAPRSRGPELEFRFRGAYIGTGGTSFVLRPFNRVLPPATAQQLHGRREDPLQTKAYGKRVDQGRRLTTRELVARQEVRLSGDGLACVGLHRLSDLQDFRFRKHLLPFLRHVKGVRRRKMHSANGSALLAILRERQDQVWAEAFAKTGVGAFERDGEHARAPVRLVSDTEVNNRIGQALLRLEQRMKFVRGGGGR